MPLLLVHEGGYVVDSGGPTERGVTQNTYDAYRTRQKAPRRDVRQMSEAEMFDIYRAQFWDRIHGDDLPSGVDYVVFDGAVNSGPVQSIKWMQRAASVDQVDGVIGNVTMSLVEAMPDMSAFVDAIEARRLLFMQHLRTWQKYGNGWGHRVKEVKAVGDAWAENFAGAKTTPAEHTAKKALITDAKRPFSKAAGGATTGAGGVTTVLSTLQTQLATHSNIPHIEQGIVGLIMAGAAITLGGMFMTYRSQQSAATLADVLDLPLPQSGTLVPDAVHT